MFCVTLQLVHRGTEVTRIHNSSCFFMHFFMFLVNLQLVSGCSEVRRSTNWGIGIFSGLPISRFENSEILHFFAFFAIFEYGPDVREFDKNTISYDF